MRIVTPLDTDFNFEECEILYNKISPDMNNNCSFKDIIFNSHFFSFYEKNILLGCIYVTSEGGKLYLNGYSIRKNHKKNIKAIKKITAFYNCSIFAKTKNRTAEFLLKKCGFYHIETDNNGVKHYKKE